MSTLTYVGTIVDVLQSSDSPGRGHHPQEPQQRHLVGFLGRHIPDERVNVLTSYPELKKANVR